MKDSIALFGPATELIMIIKQAAPEAQATVTILTFFGYVGSHLIRIWIKDNDGDGNVDMLQS